MIEPLSVGLCGNEKLFTTSYKKSFLLKHGFIVYELDHDTATFGYLSEIKGINIFNPYICTVKTKYGEVVIPDEGVVTYLGGNMWDIRKKHSGESLKDTLLGLAGYSILKLKYLKEHEDEQK